MALTSGLGDGFDVVSGDLLPGLLYEDLGDVNGEDEVRSSPKLIFRMPLAL